MHSTGLALTSALICLCWVGNGPLGGSALACLPAGLKGHPHHLLQGAAMSGQRDRSRSYHQRSSSTMRHARSERGRVHTVKRRTISTGSVRTSGKRCRSRERRGQKEDRPPTRSSRSPHRRNRRPAGDTRRRRSLTPPPPRPPLQPPDVPQPPPQPPPPPPPPAGNLGRSGAQADEPRWQRQVTAWEALAQKYGIDESRYEEFEYLTYFPIGDSYIDNYVNFQLGEPVIKGRIKSHYRSGKKLQIYRG
jgi:hypothetical protein